MAPTATYQPAQPGTGNLVAHADLPSLTRLYGGSINTTWTEPQYKIWRQRPDDSIQEPRQGEDHVPGKGAAIGFLENEGYAIVWGNPLCPSADYSQVTEQFLEWTNHREFKVVWCCIEEEMTKILANKDWVVVSCVKEDHVDPTKSADMSNLDKRVRNKVYKAQRAGLKTSEHSYALPDETTLQETEKGMNQWNEARKGAQIHLTDLQPWRDVEHRRYFYGRATGDNKGKKGEGESEAESSDNSPSENEDASETNGNNGHSSSSSSGSVVGLIVLTPVANGGWVVKWALEFPSAPKGTSESMIMHVMEVLSSEGSHELSFGASGADLKAIENIKGWKIQPLSKAYSSISSVFHLGNKGDYRSKFGAEQDRLNLAYPKDSLGMKGIDAIVSALKDNTYAAKGEGEVGGQRLQTPAVEKTDPVGA